MDLTMFHSKEYIDFLSRVTNENQAQLTRDLEKFSVGQANGDSPVFPGMFEFCQRYTGGSLTAACHMNQVSIQNINFFNQGFKCSLHSHVVRPCSYRYYWSN